MVKQQCKFDDNFNEIEFIETIDSEIVYKETKEYHPNGKIKGIYSLFGEAIEYDEFDDGLVVSVQLSNREHNPDNHSLFKRYPKGLDTLLGRNGFLLWNKR